jgi:hypothetical protein
VVEITRILSKIKLVEIVLKGKEIERRKHNSQAIAEQRLMMIIAIFSEGGV